MLRVTMRYGKSVLSQETTARYRALVYRKLAPNPRDATFLYKCPASRVYTQDFIFFGGRV